MRAMGSSADEGTLGLAPTLRERYLRVVDRVAAAARRSGRSPDRIILVAVTKTAEPEEIRELIELGHRDFGENRVQNLVQRSAVIDEWAKRVRMLPEAARSMALDESGSGAVRWHMIGHLQRNKARKVAELCRLVHSVDSLRVAEELQVCANRLDRGLDRPVEVLVQVNVSGEESKAGCPVSAAGALCEQIDTMVNVRVRGLMTMAPYSDDPEAARPHFRRLRELFEELREARAGAAGDRGAGGGRFNLLSMGMSGDFEVAIEEGANVVRVGSAIFGHRHDPDGADADGAADGSGGAARAEADGPEGSEDGD
jgi:hypothetical protein